MGSRTYVSSARIRYLTFSHTLLEIPLITPNGSRKGFQKLFDDIQTHDAIPKTRKRRIQQIHNSLSAGELNSIRVTFRNADAHTLNLPTTPDETERNKESRRLRVCVIQRALLPLFFRLFSGGKRGLVAAASAISLLTSLGLAGLGYAMRCLCIL